MGFRLKDFSDLVGIDKETSTYNTPVFKKTLEGGILGEANNDGTIFIDKSLKGKDKKEADRKSTRLNSSHGYISYAVFCLKKKNQTEQRGSAHQ